MLVWLSRERDALRDQLEALREEHKTLARVQGFDDKYKVNGPKFPRSHADFVVLETRHV